MKPLIIIVLAFVAALAVTLGAMQLRSWWSARHSSGDNTRSASSPSDQQKLAILESLSASSTATVEEKSKTLQSLSSPAQKTPSEEEKLKILQSLH
jgi:hypothetical protein